MKKVLFVLLSKLNKKMLPSMAGKDLTRLSKTDKLIVAWRYFVTKNAVD
jgi:hypothetical protein